MRPRCGQGFGAMGASQKDTQGLVSNVSPDKGDTPSRVSKSFWNYSLIFRARVASWEPLGVRVFSSSLLRPPLRASICIIGSGKDMTMSRRRPWSGFSGGRGACSSRGFPAGRLAFRSWGWESHPVGDPSPIFEPHAARDGPCSVEHGRMSSPAPDAFSSSRSHP